MGFISRRNREQAANIAQLLRQSPGEPLLVWCGNAHACKERIHDWTPMGWNVRETTEVDSFVIYQTVTARRRGRQERSVRRLGGTAGILADQAPAPWAAFPGVNAIVVSTDNAMTCTSAARAVVERDGRPFLGPVGRPGDPSQGRLAHQDAVLMGNRS